MKGFTVEKNRNANSWDTCGDLHLCGTNIR